MLYSYCHHLKDDVLNLEHIKIKLIFLMNCTTQSDIAWSDFQQCKIYCKQLQKCLETIKEFLYRLEVSKQLPMQLEFVFLLEMQSCMIISKLFSLFQINKIFYRIIKYQKHDFFFYFFVVILKSLKRIEYRVLNREKIGLTLTILPDRHLKIHKLLNHPRCLKFWHKVPT